MSSFLDDEFDFFFSLSSIHVVEPWVKGKGNAVVIHVMYLNPSSIFFALKISF